MIRVPTEIHHQEVRNQEQQRHGERSRDQEKMVEENVQCHGKQNDGGERHEPVCEVRDPDDQVNDENRREEIARFEQRSPQLQGCRRHFRRLPAKEPHQGKHYEHQAEADSENVGQQFRHAEEPLRSRLAQAVYDPKTDLTQLGFDGRKPPDGPAWAGVVMLERSVSGPIMILERFPCDDQAAPGFVGHEVIVALDHFEARLCELSLDELWSDAMFLDLCIAWVISA